MQNIVVFTGAGISAESGLDTFRDNGGLWEKYKIEDVATPEAFERNPKLVLDFYNLRRKQLLQCKPNAAHFALNELKDKYKLQIITQNVDDLHERSGSQNALHLHGKLLEAKSTLDEEIYPINGVELNIGDLCKNGSQLRPNVVWFGETVPKIAEAISITKKADIFIVIGTSLSVYPAASLLQYTKNAERIILIDPNTKNINGVEVLTEKATIAVPELVATLLK
ncbi:MAG: NAD-dependent protein deacylase [Flavobacteriales bacterium TMED123]|nr:MAG: NAD-dependent protein deacylase [Flavobacteriales bacterium TMED123]